MLPFTMLQGAAEEAVDGEEDVVSSQQWLLPAREFHGLWESYVLAVLVAVSHSVVIFRTH